MCLGYFQLQYLLFGLRKAGSLSSLTHSPPPLLLESTALAGVCFNRWAGWQTVGCKPASSEESALNDIELNARKVHGHRQTQTCMQSHTHRVHITGLPLPIPQNHPGGSSRLAIWNYILLTHTTASSSGVNKGRETKMPYPHDLLLQRNQHMLTQVSKQEIGIQTWQLSTAVVALLTMPMLTKKIGQVF